jgi:hypothetical protein
LTPVLVAATGLLPSQRRKLPSFMAKGNRHGPGKAATLGSGGLDVGFSEVAVEQKGRGRMGIGDQKS